MSEAIDHDKLIADFKKAMERPVAGQRNDTPPAESATSATTATTQSPQGIPEHTNPPQHRNEAATGDILTAGALLDRITAFIGKYVVVSDDQAVAVALWVLHTHVADASEVAAYLAAVSAEKRSGKSRLMEVVGLLVPRPLAAANATEAALFRALADKPCPTLMLDEIDTIFGPNARKENEALRGLINAGHRRGTPVLRCVGDGSKQRVERFDVFGPKMLAGIGDLPDTVDDRSIVIRMKRRAPDETVDRFRRREVEPIGGALRQQLAAWGGPHVAELQDAWPHLPDDLDDRAADVWEPLFAIADLAGGPWPEKARGAALVLSGGREGADEVTLGVRLLHDIRDVFDRAGVDHLSSAQLVDALCALEEAPWGDMFGNRLDPRRLAKRLRPYGVAPKSVRLTDGTIPKGYTTDQFADAWQRYTPTWCSTVTETPHEKPGPARDVAGVADVAATTGGLV